MTTILIPTRVRHGFDGGVGEVIRMLGATAADCGLSLIDLDGSKIPDRLPCRSQQFSRVLIRRLSHLRTLTFFKSEFPRADLVFFQTSLGRTALLRDLFYMYRCLHAKRPYAIFFHGWDEQLAEKLSASPKQRKRLARLINHARRVFVLSPSFAETLSIWGVDPGKIQVETTMIDDSLVAGFDLEKKIKARKPARGLEIVFMGRLVRAKGVYQAIEAFRLHKIRFPLSTLVFAGEGEELAALKAKAEREAIRGVRFVGFVSEAEKAVFLSDADVFLLPSYSEGLPVSLLEAMAFGNTVVSRPVGGIGHFFREPEMGYLEPSLEPERFAILLDKVAEEADSWVATANFNYEFSQRNILGSRVGRRILQKVTEGLN